MELLERVELSRHNFETIDVGDWAIFIDDGDRKSCIESGYGKFVMITKKESLFYYNRTDTPLSSLLYMWHDEHIPCCGWELRKVEGLSPVPTKAELEMLMMLDSSIDKKAVQDLNKTLFLARIWLNVKEKLWTLVKR